jgi:hypothetical protein
MTAAAAIRIMEPQFPMPSTSRENRMISHNTIRWSYWAAICALLIIGLAGRFEAFYFAAALSVAQLVHYAVRERSFTAFSVQVRLAYAAILLADILWEPLRLHLWWMAFFTLMVVFFDWCLLSRIMALMPWNRKEALSWELMRRTFFSGPVKGSIIGSAVAPA